MTKPVTEHWERLESFLESYKEEESKAWHIRQLAAKGWDRPAIRAWFENRGVPMSRGYIRDVLLGTDLPAAHGRNGRPPSPTCPTCGKPR